MSNSLETTKSKTANKKILAYILFYTGIGAFCLQMIAAFSMEGLTPTNIVYLVSLHVIFLTVGAVGWFMLLGIKQKELNLNSQG